MAESVDLKTTWILEMTAPDELRPASPEPHQLRIAEVEPPCASFSWFLHQAVGTAYRWGGREDWDQTRWTEWVSQDTLETWVAYREGCPAGYFELEQMSDDSVEIHCFGLLPQFHGQGLGRILLTEAVRRSWAMGAHRVWLTTCSHDHPFALKNYLARGFRICEQKTGVPNRTRQSLLFCRRPARCVNFDKENG